MSSYDVLVGIAGKLGFDQIGVCTALPSWASANSYRDWVATGRHAGMSWMARADRVARSLDPSLTVSGARSIVVVAKRYAAANTEQARPNDPSCGRVAAYATGPDYHNTLRHRLAALAERLGDLGRPGRTYREYVDTGPILERDAAARAGLGFLGRNAMLIDRCHGSRSLLGVIVTDADLEPTVDLEPAGTCGRCTRCISACPTTAFPRERVLDSNLCLSYLTIENRGPIPLELRTAIGNRVFGCDVCNDVCPYNNRFGDKTDMVATETHAIDISPSLMGLLDLDDYGFRERFGGTAVARAKRRGLLRNACVAAGNWGSDRPAGQLLRLLNDHEPLVRGHAAWALGRIGTNARAGGGSTGGAVRSDLEQALSREPDAWVRSEIRAALDAGGAGA